VAAQIAGKQHVWLELDQPGMAEVQSKLIRH
jgi:ATP-dependent Lhr-like helicase